MKLHRTIFNCIDNLGDHCYLTSDNLAIPHNFSQNACQAHFRCKLRPRTLPSSNDFNRSLRSDSITDVSYQSFRRGLVLDLSVAFGELLFSGTRPMHPRAVHTELDDLAFPQRCNG